MTQKHSETHSVDPAQRLDGLKMTPVLHCILYIKYTQTLHVCHICLHWGGFVVNVGIHGIHGVSGIGKTADLLLALSMGEIGGPGTAT